MNATFHLDGCYSLLITDDGRLTSGNMGASSAGNVGLQLTYVPLQIGTEERAPDAPQTLLQAFVKPSQARAIASALLSAATEARSIS